MPQFNKEISLKKVKLASPVSVELIYDPKINIHIDRQYGFFLRNVDSVYVSNIREHIVQELAEVNMRVTEKESTVRLSIEEIRLIEKNEDGTDSDNQSTTEVDVELYMKGYLYQTSNLDQKLIEVSIGTTTYTGSSLFSILFNSSDFDVQKNNTYEPGMAEKNLIKSFVETCAKNIY